MKEAVDALLKALAESGCEGARDEMPRLLAALRAPVDGDLVRDVLDKLRSRRCYAPMQVFATAVAKIADGKLQIHVKRQLAQARIELGLLGEAATLLEGLVKEVERAGTGRERSEVTGLLGRVYKQRFVQAVAGGATGEEELRAAVRAYTEVFDLDPAWHGANVVALAARAKRDGLAAGTDSAETWAQRLLDRLLERARPAWSAWDYASAGEAYLALGLDDKVAECFAQYWNMANADAFSLAGTERQLREIWQIAPGDPDELRSSLLLHLEARQLTAAKGGARYTADGLQQLARRLRVAAEQAEATFGAGSAIPLDRVLRLLDRAKSVCRVVDSRDPDRAGTGFLVNGADLCPPLDGVYVLTNHHVLHGDEATDALLASPEYAGSIDIGQALAEFHYWDGRPQKHAIKLASVERHSPRSQVDFALAALSEPVPANLALPISRAPKPLGSRNVVDARQRAKVIIVGHPKGGDLSFSVSDNEVVDHELDDEPRDRPRRIHYRTPTEPGSSGSPVFHHASLEVVGLHRTGRAKPLRGDWPRASDDETYEANEAVSMRSLLGL
jgi:hypothetical protein